MLRYFKKKKFGEVLDLYELPHGRNFQYLLKNGVLKFFAEPRLPPSRCPRVNVAGLFFKKTGLEIRFSFLEIIKENLD